MNITPEIIEGIKTEIAINASWARTYGKSAIVCIVTGDEHGAERAAKSAAWFGARSLLAANALTKIGSN